MTILDNQSNDSPINAALRQYEAAEANLLKLERIFAEIRKLTPNGICFGSDPRYEDRVRAYEDVLAALPKIDAWKPEHTPIDLGEITSELAADEEVDAPGRELARYRYLLNKKRRQLIRTAMLELLDKIDGTLRVLNSAIREETPRNQDVTDPLWEELKTRVQAIDMLLGGALPRPSRWAMLQRHLGFGMVQDLLDITRLDWPEVKSGLTKNLYDRDEPIPVDVADLAELAVAQPTGSVVTKLRWDLLDDEGFERLIFSIISMSPGYENPQWLTATNAADRGRDLSVTRIHTDQLSGTIRSRVLIQCKHWLSKSVSVPQFAALKEQMALWEPPKVDVLIIATSGRFTCDAVSAIEKHNEGDRALRVEMWPESHLERLLAERPALIAEFQLR